MIVSIERIITDPERLSKNDKGSKGDAWISPGRENRIDFASGLGVAWDENRRDQVAGSAGGRVQEVGSIWGTMWKPSAVQLPQI